MGRMVKNKKTKKIIKIRKRSINFSRKSLGVLAVAMCVLGILAFMLVRHVDQKSANEELEQFRAQPLSKVRVLASPRTAAAGISPSAVKSAYNVAGGSGGSGTIAIVNAYNNPRVDEDLAVFNRRFGLRGCTKGNGCFEKHKMARSIATKQDWAMESSLDVQWAHAIAPNAKILLVEAKSNSGTDLLRAIDYARNRNDVVAISLSWGGSEFSSERFFNNRFDADEGVSVFAASGDWGHGTLWPASSPNVISVGGTTLTTRSGEIISETAWSGSGGGKSRYEPQPGYQANLGINNSHGKRAIPDVSYNANPRTGFPVYHSLSYNGSPGWFLVGGTSAGAPQWAAIHARSGNVDHERLYEIAAGESADDFLRDITTGTNGSCSYYCRTRSGYDFVTGLGSPRSIDY